MTATGSSLIALHKQSCARERSIYVCGELLLIARLNNSPTHEKRPKAYAEPKAAVLRRGGRSNLHVRPSVDRGASHARATAKFDFWVT